MNIIKDFLKEEDGVGVIEVILILVVLIGLVLIFKDKITELITNSFDSITTNGTSINTDISM